MLFISLMEKHGMITFLKHANAKEEKRLEVKLDPKLELELELELRLSVEALRHSLSETSSRTFLVRVIGLLITQSRIRKQSMRGMMSC